MNNYTTLCDCPETQDGHKWKAGDAYGFLGHVLHVPDDMDKFDAMVEEYPDKRIYLPSTGDLLDMLDRYQYSMTYDTITYIIVPNDDSGLRFHSPDRNTALLRAWMHLKHGKALGKDDPDLMGRVLCDESTRCNKRMETEQTKHCDECGKERPATIKDILEGKV